jgi:YD repeat-containing protein
MQGGRQSNRQVLHSPKLPHCRPSTARFDRSSSPAKQRKRSLGKFSAVGQTVVAHECPTGLALLKHGITTMYSITNDRTTDALFATSLAVTSAVDRSEVQTPRVTGKALAIAACFLWALAAHCLAQGPVPCTPNWEFPEYQTEHSCELASARVRTIPNPDGPSGRPYDTSQLDVIDPCAGRSFVDFDVNYQWPNGRSGAFVWRTEAALPGVTPFESACFNPLVYRPVHSNYWLVPTVVLHDIFQGHGGGSGHYQFFGYGLGVNLLQPLSLGDFLPRGRTLADSSLALVPSGLQASPTGWQGLNRPTVAEAADLITGAPLVQVTDLELPFGGSTFRLNRTRSAGRHGRQLLSHYSGGEEWWNWTGLGWMVSENPFLIIDSALSDVVGDNPRTIRLVLDAHHSIPFQLIESDGRYEAPPRFRAVLRHNGLWQSGQWAPGKIPTHFEISLFEGALRYTFVAIREDVPANQWDPQYVTTGNLTSATTPSSYHDRPLLPNQFLDPRNGTVPTDARATHNPFQWETNPGFGIPYYGLCTRIEDQHGHIVEITYCDSRRRHMDDPRTADCIECQQDGLAKGQIAYIKLKKHGNAGIETAWTLLYAHRKFAGLRWGITDHSFSVFYDIITSKCPSEDPGRYEIHGHNVIDRIYVFEGDISSQLLDGLCLTIAHTASAGFDVDFSPSNPADPIAIHNAGAQPGQHLPTGWVHQVRYHYDHWQDEYYLNLPYPWLSGQWFTYPWVHGMEVGRPKTAPVLTMRTTATQDPAVPHSLRLEHSVYHYGATQWGGWSGTGDSSHVNDTQGRNPWLAAVFTPEDVNRVLADPPAAVKAHPGLTLTLKLLALGRDEYVSLQNYYGAMEAIQEYASQRFAPGADWQSSSGSTRPSIQDLQANGFIVQGGRFIDDNTNGVMQDFSIRDDTGVSRHYRFHRLTRVPGGTGSFELLSYIPAGEEPMASRWFIPYAWQGYMPSPGIGGSLELAHTPDLSEVRHLVFVDEFSNHAAMVSYQEVYGQNALKPGQTSRQMFEINASGVVLKHRRWDFTPDGTMVSGSGLGEEFHYQTIADYFADHGIIIETCPPMEIAGAPPGTNPYTGANPYQDCNDSGKPTPAMARELLLVERRSVGWSAVPEPQQDEEGLVEFFQYKLHNAPNVPWRSRVQLEAVGIQKGKGLSPALRLYNQQIFRDLDDPTRVLCQVDFVEPTTILLSQPPDLASAASASNYAVVFTFEEHGQSWSPEFPPPVTSRMVVSPPRRLRPDGPPYFPIEREVYDHGGSVRWSVTGLVQDPMNPGVQDPHASLVFTYYDRGSLGMPAATIVDLEPTDQQVIAPNGVPVTVEPFPDQWPRLGTGTALRYTTAFEYDTFGPTDIYFPSGRRWARRWVPHLPQEDEETHWVEEFIFNNLVPVAGTTLFTTQSPGERKEYGGRKPTGGPRAASRVFFTEEQISIELQGEVGFGPLWSRMPRIAPEYEEVARVEFALDSDGRPRNAELLEPNDQGVLQAVGFKQVNDLVDVVREREIDGTVSRRTRSLIGQHMRSYIGTFDFAWEGDQALKDQNGNYFVWNNNQQEFVDHNMVILERLEYGTGPTDAWLPTVHRRYMHHPEWADHFYVPPSSDPDGFATVTTYDWRMRPVRQDTYDRGVPGGPAVPRLATTLTYLDHADRPRFVVAFGQGTLSLPAALDPVQHLGPEGLPDAADFYALSLKPLSIIEFRYGVDGRLNETRRYDMAWNGSGTPPYQAEFTYYGRGGAVVFSQRPGGTVTINALDGLGRTAETRAVAPWRSQTDPYAYEISRTDYLYDDNGNAIDVSHYERADGSANASDRLDDSNAVRTRTVSWYDTERRLIAIADLGTERTLANEPGGSFVAGPKVFERQAAPSLVSPLGIGSTPSINREGVPNWAPLTLNIYDIAKGNLLHTIHPNGSVTSFVYGRSNRLVERVENAFAADEKERRTTQHDHKWGRLFRMTAALPYFLQHVPIDPLNTQVTEVVYGADILDHDFNAVSRNNGLIGAMWLPHMWGTTADSQTAITLRYNFSGQIAERIDVRGVALRYRYDGLQRLQSVEVGHYSGSTFVAGYPSTMTPPTGVPVDRIGFVEYVYTPRGELYEVIARTKRINGLQIARTRFAYDLRGNLQTEWQARAELVTSAPRVDYSWQYMPTGPSETGFTRLSSMLYPSQVGLARRQVTLGYGAAGSLADQMSLTSGISTNLGTITSIANLTYLPSGRRRSLSLGAGAAVMDLRLGSEMGLAGLDRFGQIADLHYRNGSSPTDTTLFRAEYTYDISRNRRTARITQAPEPNLAAINMRSQLNEYSLLNQLLATQVGSLDLTDPNQPVIQANTFRRVDQWNLDAIGNWNASAENDPWGQPLPGRTTAILADGSPATIETTNVTDGRNRIVSQRVDTGSASPPDFIHFDYDPNGNLVCDGKYYYQYDAWNRLIQVNRAAQEQLQEPILASDGVTWVYYRWIPGTFLKHYAYDGLGRLTRTQSPYPHADYPGARLRSEHFYYDGIRRIQEVFHDPVMALDDEEVEYDLALAASRAVILADSDQPLDGSAAPLAFEDDQDDPVEPEIIIALDREYVWGPGGVDELLVQYDRQRNPWWVILDDGGDVVALCDRGAPGGAGRVVAQWTWDAYGQAVTATHLHAHALIRCGHKALFVDRLDVGVASSTGSEQPRIVPFAHNLAHNRNRVYMPGLGRFLQPDPKDAGQTLLASSYNGRGVGALAVAFDLQGHYGDGMNIYEYLGSNPWRRSDPLGLSWDPFDMVDSYMAEAAGANAAFMERIVGGARVAAYVGAVVLSMLPFPVTAIAADIGASVLEGHMPPELVAARKILGYAALGAIAVTVTKLGYSAAKAAFHYVQKYGMRGAVSNLWSGGAGLAKRAWERLRKPKVAGACGCFVAGTLVWTSSGMVPIEEVQIGDVVLAKDQMSGELTFQLVEAEIVVQNAALLELTLQHPGRRVETILTTDEHPFWVKDQGWTRADTLLPGQELEGLGGQSLLLAMTFSHERRTVYNLTIGDDPNYFIGPDGIWVHNCGPGRHHLWPMYMKGAPKGARTPPLGSREHTELHKFIDDAAVQRGMPRKVGNNNVTREFDEWYTRTNVPPGTADHIITEVLSEAYINYDMMFKTDFHRQFTTFLRSLP